MNKTTAIIIDDVAESRDLLKKTLRNFNCICVKESNTGRGSVKLIRDFKPDFVFLDLHMPNHSGLDVLKDLKHENIFANVWIVSGEAKEKHKQELRTLNTRGFIHKPFKSNQIGHIIEEYHANFEYNHKLTALVVDDDESLRKLLRHNLFATGKFIETEEVSSAEDAIRRFENKIFNDITFIDIEMEKMNGIQLLQYIKENAIPTYPIIISAHSNFENVKQAIEFGSKAFIVKPFSMEKLHEIVETYLSSKIRKG